MENDTATGGEELSIDQAAAAYAKLSTNAVQPDHAEDEEPAQGDTTDDELQAADEDAGEEDDGETADADHADSEDDDAEEPNSEQGRFVADNARVRITNPDGTLGYTTVAELKRGSLREADYTRKTQEVSAKTQEVERQSAAIKASEQQIAQQREVMISALNSIVPPEPAIDMLMTDPMGYQVQKAQREQWLQYLNHLDSTHKQSLEERKAEAEKASKGRLEQEWAAALEKLPELKDSKRLEAFGNEVLKYGAEYGYTPQELANIHHDHRNLVVLKKAMAWDKLQASKPNVQKKVEGRPPVQKGGKRLNPAENKARAVSDAFNRLKQSGSAADAAAAYLASRKG